MIKKIKFLTFPLIALCINTSDAMFSIRAGRAKNWARCCHQSLKTKSSFCRMCKLITGATVVYCGYKACEFVNDASTPIEVQQKGDLGECLYELIIDCVQQQRAVSLNNIQNILNDPRLELSFKWFSRVIVLIEQQKESEQKNSLLMEIFEHPRVGFAFDRNFVPEFNAAIIEKRYDDVRAYLASYRISVMLPEKSLMLAKVSCSDKQDIVARIEDIFYKQYLLQHKKEILEKIKECAQCARCRDFLLNE